MSFSFYFLLGQAITFLGIKWDVTLIINLILITIIEIIHQSSFILQPFALLIGWFSIVLIPNFFLKSQTNTFLFTVSTQILILLYFCEIVIFGMITSFIYYDDHDSFSWFVLLLFHTAFILCVTTIDSKLEKNVENLENESYETVFAVCILSSDVMFLFFSLFDIIRFNSFFIVSITGIFSFVCSYLMYLFFKKENLTVIQ